MIKILFKDGTLSTSDDTGTFKEKVSEVLKRENKTLKQIFKIYS